MTYNLRTILPFSPSGLISTSTRSPGNTRILCIFIFPARCARTSVSKPFILTRNIKPGRASYTLPSFAASVSIT